jgi:hypothetical protein
MATCRSSTARAVRCRMTPFTCRLSPLRSTCQLTDWPIEASNFWGRLKVAGTLRVPQSQNASKFVSLNSADGTRSVPAAINSQPRWAEIPAIHRRRLLHNVAVPGQGGRKPDERLLCSLHPSSTRRGLSLTMSPSRKFWIRGEWASVWFNAAPTLCLLSYQACPAKP